ncbi:MAG TPA: TetR family transcriptional regulator [Allosphingosinicella sp.]|nr:TetR family transcriptional regulator [Allosphingosinicella sp.]
MSPRAKCAASTRDTMLACARRRFLEESYENVGLRDIARDVGVDVALVGRYFGSKENLFHEVLRGTRCDWLDAGIGAEELPAFLAAMVLRKEEAEDREDLDRLLIILRSASSPKASELVRTAFREDVIEPVARLLPGPDAELRVAIAFSIVTGTSVMRTFMGVEPLLGCEERALEDKLARLLKDALIGDPVPTSG